MNEQGLFVNFLKAYSTHILKSYPLLIAYVITEIGLQVCFSQ